MITKLYSTGIKEDDPLMSSANRFSLIADGENIINGLTLLQAVSGLVVSGLKDKS
jgi:hypothetical protein